LDVGEPRRQSQTLDRGSKAFPGRAAIVADRLDLAEPPKGLGLFVCQMAAAAWLKVFAPEQQG
jgi:hypothetical protein